MLITNSFTALHDNVFAHNVFYVRYDDCLKCDISDRCGYYKKNSDGVLKYIF